ncbi:WD40-like Beta Propeller Repeat [Daejeonella rubra]|uniref:WD40-like Beta Propeller Repeat n=1 Tax=Daejeonella rubra TaxID=990371 RepID=A0A1G9XX53_9SPHI|nr:OmpA family protein [Daejeonella rubra]SDN00755.1 WD40-like Beta Propeller Repeat [Daejeonella rubra]
MIVQPLWAQQMDNSPLLRKALVEYQNLRFATAIRELDKVLEKEPDNVSAQEMMAGSNRNIKNYVEAMHWYGELCKLKKIKPEWALYYAEALANKEKYEQSEQWYRKFLSLRPADRRADAFSKANLSSFSSNAGEYKVAYSSINTDDSEYSPMYYKNGLLFISNRQQKNRYVFQWDRTSYSDMYVIDDLNDIAEAEPDSTMPGEKKKAAKYIASDYPAERSLLSLFSTPKQDEGTADQPALLRGKVRSSYHEGPAVLLPEGTLLFTRNNFVGGKVSLSRSGVNKLKLYTASGASWDKITPFPYNNNEYSTGHPTVSADGNILIFASDMPRGFGGTDLYYCVRTGEGKKWGRPTNLGSKINTEGNEQFPYLHKNGKLYFSSTGHPGLGGLDIFEVVLRDLKAIGNIHNLGSDINSAADDFGFIQDEDAKTGFFSSNRRGNDDIYQFNHMTYTVVLRGQVVDAENNKPLPGSRVILRHNGIVDSIQTNANAEFTKVLSKETDYEISGNRISYVSKQNYLSTSGITVDSTMKVTLKLNRAENMQQWVIDNCAALKKTFSLENIYYDLDQSEIRPDAMLTLDKIAEVMNKNPEITIISASHTDSRATDNYNKELSLRRGEAARSYLISKGIDGRRIEVRYYGKSRLINTCIEGADCPEFEQQRNRRTEFEVILNGVNLTQLTCDK